MAPPEPCGLTKARLEQPKTDEAEENEHKNNAMIMIEVI